MSKKKHILVAPLNWGLGHATRCIPIITALLTEEFEVTIASDGNALALLKKEFPALRAITLPGYDITYALKAKDFKRKIFSQTAHIRRTIKEEKKVLDELLRSLQLDGVISDSRFGLHTKEVPCVFITHQLTVLSGKLTSLTSYLHKRYIHKFTECWVPDYESAINLSGILGHPAKLPMTTKYIGPLSRMEVRSESKKYDITAILSGPEPQRSLLEELLMNTLKKYNGTILLVQGIIEEDTKSKKVGNIEVVNFLTTEALEKAINQSQFIISRSGYTTIMDLQAMEKKAFFIPTPGQPEQEYLASYLKNKGIVPYASQENFKVKDLAKITAYKGFSSTQPSIDLRDFFGLFEGERKLRTDPKLALNVNFLLVRLHNMLNNGEPQT